MVILITLISLTVAIGVIILYTALIPDDQTRMRDDEDQMEYLKEYKEKKGQV